MDEITIIPNLSNLNFLSFLTAQNSSYTQTFKYITRVSIFIAKIIFLNAPNNVLYETQ